MQRLFSMFPSGLPGVALLLLRVSVASTVSVHLHAGHSELAAWTLAALLALTATLVVGILTPIAALLAIAAQFAGPYGVHVPTMGIVTVNILNALALALLGPGAYSFDAFRFGRRVVELPSNDDN
jgi:hypothetical protein